MSFVNFQWCPTVQPAKGYSSKIRQCNIKSGENWQGALKQNGTKQMGIKQWLPLKTEIFNDVQS